MSRAVAVEIQPIDRLEEKVKQMVSVIDSLRAEKSRALDESARLQQEIGGAEGAPRRGRQRRQRSDDAPGRAGADPDTRVADADADRQTESVRSPWPTVA